MDDKQVGSNVEVEAGGAETASDWEEIGRMIRKAVDHATETLFDGTAGATRVGSEVLDGSASHHEWMTGASDEPVAMVTIAGAEED